MAGLGWVLFVALITDEKVSKIYFKKLEKFMF